MHKPGEVIQASANVRKILVSVKFMSAILGPEMAAPILWTPRISAFFLQENLHVHKIPRFGGVFGVWGGGGGSADFIFMGAGIFLRMQQLEGSLTEDPSRQENHYDNGRGFHY